MESQINLVVYDNFLQLLKSFYRFDLMVLYKKLLVLVLVISASSISFGQKLFGIDMDTTVEAFCSQMVNKGFKYSKSLKSTKNYIVLEGNLLGEKDVNIAVYNTVKSREVWQVMALININCNTIDDLDREYFHFKRLLSHKYGETDDCNYNIDEDMVRILKSSPELLTKNGDYKRECYWEAENLFIQLSLKHSTHLSINWQSELQLDLANEEEKLKIIDEL